MAKEMMIIFVYDTELLQKEEDDPASAILYFHPGWVSDQQRTALCGQIIGTCHFLKTAFQAPRIFALQSGKFSIRCYGRYIMAVGTDRNIADWVLEHRADILTSLICFFHQDLQKLSELYPGSIHLSAKLYHMFETYLKILMYGGHTFYNIPTIQLPKSASHVFLDAVQLLESCQQITSVLGGTILFHNKVVATQLSTDLTKKLVLTDPYRIKSPAEMLGINFSLPLGVQLLQVYIAHEDYQKLREDAGRFKSMSQYLNKINSRKTANKVSTREPMLSTMKRDQSLIFTTVPEEDTDQHSPINMKEYKSPDRPKFLNLKLKTSDVKCEVKTAPPSTPFLGQTSVCSTPMTDLNKVLHSNAMSICVNPEDSFVNIETSTSINGTDKFDSCVPYVPESNLFDKKRSASMWELREKLKIFNKRITMRYYSIGLSSLNDSDVDVEYMPKLVRHKTISDPIFPIVKSDGVAVSNFLYNKYLQEPILSLNGSDIEQSLEKYESPKRIMALSPIKTLQRLITPKSKENRKSLTLPLKSLTSENDSLFNRQHGGVQLTPLMSKLSLLAMEERSSGFCSKDTTPGDYKDARFTPSQPNYSFLSRRKSSASDDSTDSVLQKAVLFVCGQQDMVMGILLEDHVKNSPEVVNELWEKCTESLGKLERQLRHSLETYAGGSTQGENNDPYSYLCMDPQWDNVRRGGPWGAAELGMLTHLHRDFLDTSNLTEIILRNDETLIYGHHCGKTEVFYQQVATGTAGLPTPADPMGTVSLKAKRRLERDHSIILL